MLCVTLEYIEYGIAQVIQELNSSIIL